MVPRTSKLICRNSLFAAVREKQTLRFIAKTIPLSARVRHFVSAAQHGVASILNTDDFEKKEIEPYVTVRAIKPNRMKKSVYAGKSCFDDQH